MLIHFRELLADEIRIQAFKKAIFKVVDEHTAIAEIGFALGTYSFFAAMKNAKSIYAIEMGDIFHIGTEIARQNNFYDKITFYHNHSKEVKLPEKVDYLIMEDYTPMLAYRGLYDTIVDARQRFLKPSGKFIPNTFILKFALVEYEDFYNDLHIWKKENDLVYDINWEYTTELVFNRAHYATKPGIKLLSKEIVLSEIDMMQSNDITFKFSDDIQIKKPGTIHGIIGWWDCWFRPDQYFSNSPLEPVNTWGQMYFPIRNPVKVAPKDSVKVNFSSYRSKISGEIDYLWRIFHKGNTQEYNTFAGRFYSKEMIDHQNPDYKPALNNDGEIAKIIFNRLDGKTSINDTADILQNKFPDRFPNRDKCIAKISGILKGYI